MTDVDPEVFEERRALFLKGLRKGFRGALVNADGRYSHLPAGAEDGLLEAVEREYWPDFILRDGEPMDYWVQIFLSTACSIVPKGLDHAVAKLDEARSAEMPRDLAQDGSRGQWHVRNSMRVNTLEWLLGVENDDD